MKQSAPTCAASPSSDCGPTLHMLVSATLENKVIPSNIVDKEKLFLSHLKNGLWNRETSSMNSTYQLQQRP